MVVNIMNSFSLKYMTGPSKYKSRLILHLKLNSYKKFTIFA